MIATTHPGVFSIYDKMLSFFVIGPDLNSMGGVTQLKRRGMRCSFIGHQRRSLFVVGLGCGHRHGDLFALFENPAGGGFGIEGDVVGEAVGVGDAVVIGLPKVVPFDGLVQLDELAVDDFV